MKNERQYRPIPDSPIFRGCSTTDDPADGVPFSTDLGMSGRIGGTGPLEPGEVRVTVERG